jgi:hypothetical protein
MAKRTEFGHDVSTLEAQLVPVDEAKLAVWLSRIFHPFLVAPLSIIVVLYLAVGSVEAALKWALICAAFVVLPAILFLYSQLKRGQVSDADLTVREHRYGLYAVGGICMVACLAYLYWAQAPGVLIAALIAAVLANGIAMAVNRLGFKISVHVGTMAGIVVALCYFSLPLAVVVGLITVAVSWARKVLKRHTWAQIVVAWAVAAGCTIGVFGVYGIP